MSLLRAGILTSLLAVSGCAALPPVIMGGALGVAAGVLRLDDDLLNAWLAAKGMRAVPAPPAETRP